MPDPNLSSFIWSVADLLRGDYKQSEYGKVILPFTVLRRLDCVLEPTKAAVLAELDKRTRAKVNPEPFLLRKAGQLFYNTSPLDMKMLMGDQDHIGENLRAYIQAFSPAVRDIFESFEFHIQIDRLAKAKLLYIVTEKFANIDLHPDKISNDQMGHVFEELIRKFAELSNETAGEHFTPREVIRLMVNLLFIEDDQALTKPGVVRSIYDPTAGTGGMLSVADEHLAAMNPNARLVMHGQELNPESYAICKADMLIKGQDIGNIIFGNTLSSDGLPGKHFDYMLSNPPFGVEWNGSARCRSIGNLDRLKRSTRSCKNGIWGDEAQQDENDIPCVRVADFDRQRLRVVLDEPTIPRGDLDDSYHWLESLQSRSAPSKNPRGRNRPRGRTPNSMPVRCEPWPHSDSGAADSHPLAQEHAGGQADDRGRGKVRRATTAPTT